MKKIINNIDDIVNEMCKGIVIGKEEQLEYLKKYKIIKVKNIDKEKVTLISGGGSGHEPAHAGFVGDGMIDVAVCGDVFASPSTVQVYNALLKTRSNKGTLLIIKNYSGDCMNFDSATEMAVEDDNLEVERVYVNDDVCGKRGVAGTVFVHKIAGACAKEGNDLQTVKRVAQKTINNTKSVAFALTSCTVPAKGSPTFKLEEDSIEFGVGIHGEAGIEKRKLKTADELAKDMVDKLLEHLNLDDLNNEIAVIVNGLGATPLMELYVLKNSIHKILTERKIKVHKYYVGNYMTALDMSGASLSILKLDNELKKFLDIENKLLF